MYTKHCLILILALSYFHAHAQECRNPNNLTVIANFKEIQSQADQLLKRLQGFRSEKDLNTKLTGFLTVILELKRLHQSHQGPDNLWNHAITPAEWELYKKRRETEYDRLSEALSRARHNLQNNKFKKSTAHDLEFSVNALLEVAIRNTRNVSTAAQDDAEGQKAFCILEQETREGKGQTILGKLNRGASLVLDSVLVTPLSNMFPNSKYNMAITRIEGVNQSVPSGSTGTTSNGATK